MMLNFSNWSGVKRDFVLIVFILIVGCTGLNESKTPTPIYKTSQATNPYEKITIVPEKSVEIFEPTNDPDSPFEPKLTPIPPETHDQQWEWPLSTTSQTKKKQTRKVRRALSPAILALVTEADHSTKNGDYESAVVTIERALRIDSRNPLLTYKLAKLRLKQSKPRLAEDLAKKAALLSANDRLLKKQAWLLISEARKQQNNYLGAKEAKLKANNI